MSDSHAIGNRLRLARARCGFSQHDLASQCGATAAQLGNWERGTRAIRSDDLAKLAQALQISVDWLLGNPGTQPLCVCPACHGRGLVPQA